MNSFKKWLFPKVTAAASVHLGLLLLRLGAGLYMGLFHGKNALLELLNGNTEFPDPLGMGSGAVKFLMGVFAEFFCAWLVVLGLFTRLACIPLVVGLGIAVFVQHAADDLFAKNLSFMYLCAFATLMLTGAGRYSLDGKLFNRGKS